ncbi:thioredoxin family protein [bacterium]|nr:thioredoxin family protein [bacterium]
MIPGSAPASSSPSSDGAGSLVLMENARFEVLSVTGPSALGSANAHRAPGRRGAVDDSAPFLKLPSIGSMRSLLSVAATGGFLSVCCSSFSQVAAQEPVSQPAEVPDAVQVVDLSPATEGALGWSAKGKKVPLQLRSDGLSGSIDLGPRPAASQSRQVNPAIELLLVVSKPGGAYDRLQIDANRDGVFQPAETIVTEAAERNGKTWTSFNAVLDVAVTAPDGQARVLPYPVRLWHVFDPTEPDADPILRWSALGWMEGQFDGPDGPVMVALAESELDSIYMAEDLWALGRTASELRSFQSFRDLDDHNWCGEEAWKIVDVHPSGLQISLRRFDPGVTRAEEQAARDAFRDDKRAKRAKEPLAFLHDFKKAEAAAQTAGRQLFLDFETSWCGPCKKMDLLVYSAQGVVDAAAKTVCVKLDGDKEKELVKRFRVTAYPTMVLLGADGTEIRRAVGYRSVAQMRGFF